MCSLLDGLCSSSCLTMVDLSARPCQVPAMHSGELPALSNVSLEAFGKQLPALQKLVLLNQMQLSGKGVAQLCGSRPEAEVVSSVPAEPVVGPDVGLEDEDDWLMSVEGDFA